jgi:hypothetical protein
VFLIGPSFIENFLWFLLDYKLVFVMRTAAIKSHTSTSVGYSYYSTVFQIIPPVYSVFPVEEADTVFRRLSQCQINGRAVLRVFSDADSVDAGSNSSLFAASASGDSIGPSSPISDEMMQCASPGAESDRTGFFLP